MKALTCISALALWWRKFLVYFCINKSQKYKSQKAIKEIERELQVIWEKKQSPLIVSDYLAIQVLRLPFWILENLLFYLLVPQSEALIERGFLYMKMIMTDRRTDLDSENLEELMCLPHRNKCLSAEKVNNIIEIW